MKIFLAICLIGTVYASAYTEFNKNDFKVTESKIDKGTAEHLILKQPRCYEKTICYAFKPFGSKVCANRKYVYSPAAYGDSSSQGRYGDSSGQQYGGDSSGPDGYSNENVHPHGYGGDSSGPDGYDSESYGSKPHSAGYSPKIVHSACEYGKCAWKVNEAFSKCFGKVQLYRAFSVCGTQCRYSKKAGYNDYAKDCGVRGKRYGSHGYETCSCQTIFCVKNIYTAFFEDYRKDYTSYDMNKDQYRTIRRGTLRYKFPCKCSCRGPARH